MKKYIYTLFLTITLGFIVSSCESFLSPEHENRLTEEQLMENPSYVEGLLMNAYIALPSQYDFELDVASDDAVSNDQSSAIVRMVRGEWTAQNNPVGTWGTAYNQIFYINAFLDRLDQTVWAEDEYINELHKKRLTGEAHGLRAYYQFQLLQAHAGKDANGNLLGFPIVKETINVGDDYQLPRDTYEACVAQIISDCDVAISMLPDRYVNTGNADFDEAMGSFWFNRMDGYSVRALKSRVLLYAASPAYNTANDVSKWENAANAAGSFYQSAKGTPSALSSSALTFYAYGSGPVNDDVIWSRAVSSSLSMESANFPPSRIGQGRTNPTQNLVDAFPMKNGYPIDDPLSGFDPTAPYNNRDMRLSFYILYDGNTLGLGDPEVFRTYVGAPKDGVNVQQNSTRTGYYLRKFMLPSVKLENPSVTQLHFYTFFRYTEVLLNYAEAANEAWGPDVDGGGIGFTARNVVAALRERAGIEQPDNYLTSLTSKDELRVLIRNERRLELCFEGHRFWDIRRWSELTTMNAPVSGSFRNGASGEFSYQSVESRVYQDYMQYGPIPYDEVLKYDALVQNSGW